MSTPEREPWEVLSESIEVGDLLSIDQQLESFSVGDTALALSRLASEDLEALIRLLPPQRAASMLEELPNEQAAYILHSLPIELASPVINELSSDHKVDVLQRLDEPEVESVLETMLPVQAAEVRARVEYDPSTAGGLMITELLSYPAQASVEEIIADLRRNTERYRSYDIQYAYVVSDDQRLTGVLRMRDLLLSKPQQQAREIAIRDPLSVHVQASLDDLMQFFERKEWFGVPVVDAEGRLLGVVRRQDVIEAAEEQTSRTFLKLAGILGGEELRSLPFQPRVTRRLTWLTLNLVMDFIAVSVIALYEQTLAAVVALAVFLPIISDMGGNAGSQSIAISIRELSLGMLRPRDMWYVIRKELFVGILSGLVIGIFTAAAAIMWKGNPVLGIVVGVGLWANLTIATCIGGIMPLILKRSGLDPAMASGPILTTITDMVGFFVTLSLAAAMLNYLV